jgi:signal transduction histidine kinase
MSEMAVALRDRERAEELERQQYFHQEKMSAIGTLASGIMHEIGNPVMAISGLVHELQTQDRDTAGPNGLSDTRYGQILQQLERVTAILGDVSEFTMPLPLEREVLDLNVLIDSAYRMLRFDRRLAKIGCIRELDHALPAISGITDHLSQVVMSLLLNALDAVESLEDRAPIIMIRTRPAGEQVELTVQDNGCGMDSDTRRQAFDAFFTSKAEGKGSGLGLTLCQSIVDEHDGAIELDSVQDVGTTVRILLPALSETENEHLF